MLRTRRNLLRLARPGTHPLRIPTVTHNYLSCALYAPRKKFFHTHQIPDILNPVPPRVRFQRDPTQSPASQLQRVMENDGFRTWGFVLYRCTYKSDSDWEKFMQRYLEPITRVLTDGNGADILARFAPTVFEDPSFEGASSFTIRDHFNKWATTAPQEEQGVSAEEAQQKLSGRYKFCIMADEECVQSVLNAPASDSSDASAFVRLVYGGWKPLELSDEEIAGYDHYEPEVLDPIEGCTERDVGAMRVRYQVAQHHGYAVLHDNLDWELKYVRAPKVGLCI